MWGGEGEVAGLRYSGKSPLVERRLGMGFPSKVPQVLIFWTHLAYPQVCGQPGGVAFPLEEEMGVYEVSPSSTCVRLLPSSVGSLGNRVDFVPESSEVGQNRALFKCTIMSFWT